MYVIGLTGGIGSGKTAASSYFEALGITVVDADIVARRVVEPGTTALANIAKHFGDKVLQADGQLDRAKLRQRIFNHPEEKRWLEALLHPIIRQQIQSQLEAAHGDYAILSAPLLLEGELWRRCDRILVTDVPEELQLQRTTSRDNNAPEKIQRIMQSQLPRQQRLEKADDVIDNSGDLKHLRQQVEDLHQQYLELARG